jgi:hypothetical protein
MATNNIYTVARTGTAGFSGDGGFATRAQLNQRFEVLSTADGGFHVADSGNHRVRRVVMTDGTITTVAGTGAPGFSGDGGPATAAELNIPEGLALTSDGGVLVVDNGNHAVRLIAADGTISTVAGTGTAGFSGDRGPAVTAELNGPVGVATTTDGGFLICDKLNHVIRRVVPDSTITTVAGDGTSGFIGDGGPATAAQLDAPDGVDTTFDGGFLIADTRNHVIRRVSATGTIDTVAGNVAPGFAGDGGPAISAQLDTPTHVVALADGGFLIADLHNHRVRRVSSSGRITTIAGSGGTGGGGDGGLATLASLDSSGVALALDGGVLIASAADARIRYVDGGL